MKIGVGVNVIKGGITAPKGFIASGIACGIKKNKPDLGLLFSLKKAVCVGFFTSNKVKAAPVLIGLSRIKKAFHRAVIINAGCANCLTGKRGISDSKLVAKETASILGVNEQEVIPCSTGSIGKSLEVKKIVSKLPALISRLSANGSYRMARAIMTTDTRPKEFACSLKIGNKEIKIGGVAKGAGMIHPDLATTICVISTDAEIKKQALKTIVNEAVENSFNRITVDGDMSTNDTLLCFANGASGIKVSQNTTLYNKFKDAVSFVALSLAKMVVKDGEGTTKFIEVEVKGAKTRAQAKKVAFGIANSNLVKTAIYGQDPNVGRIASACGAADKGIDQDKLDIYLNNKPGVEKGRVCNLRKIRHVFKKKNINIKCNLNIGKAAYNVFTSDLSPEYIGINAEYGDHT